MKLGGGEGHTPSPLKIHTWIPNDTESESYTEA